jgi:hypothetical protein
MEKKIQGKVKHVTKKLQKFIDSIAVVKKSNVPTIDADFYYSKVDGSYLTHVGLEDDLKFLLRKGITDQVISGLGFNPTEQKWYGWSHRAIYGYGIGSECTMRSIGYRPENKEAFIKHLKSLDERLNPNHKCTYDIREEGVFVKSEFLGYPEDKSQDKFIGDMNIELHRYPKKWGRGEWTAKTLEESKLMAESFAEGVS